MAFFQDDARPVEEAKAPCAMVPLKPNELSRPVALTHTDSSAGMSNCGDAIETRCPLSLRPDELITCDELLNNHSCGLTVVMDIPSGTRASEASPPAAADASK